MVVLDALLRLGRGGEHHGARLDAAHLDGLEVADNDNLAALHLLERHEAVEARAHGAAHLALVLGRVLGAGRVADGDGGDVQRVGFRVLDGLEDVADAEVDETGGEGRGGRRSGLGAAVLVDLLLLLLLLGLSSGGGGVGGGLDDLVLDLDGLLDSGGSDLLGAVDNGGGGALDGGSGGLSGGKGSGLLLLQALLLGLGVDGGLDVEDLVGIDSDLVGNVKAEERAVLDKVDETDNVGAALLAGALLGGPGLDEGGDGLVDGDVGLGGLGAEDGGAGSEVGVEGVEDSGLVVRGLDGVGLLDPLLDLLLLGGSVLVGIEGGHDARVKQRNRSWRDELSRKDAAESGTGETEGEQLE